MKHGHCSKSATPQQRATYNSWHCMIARCSYSNRRDAPWYFDKGITFDPRWKDYTVFVEDMGLRPPGKTLGRRDHRLGYCFDNCEWQTDEEQYPERYTTQAKEIDYIVEELHEGAEW